MKKIAKMLLLIGGAINICVAILHIAIMFIGTSAYNYFGAPLILIQMSEHNQFFPLISVMLLITVGFFIAGLYGFSGVTLIRRLPFLRTIILFIGIIYTLRGGVVFLIPFPNFVNKIMLTYPSLLGMGRPIMYQDWIFSFVWLFVGLTYLVGAICLITFRAK